MRSVPRIWSADIWVSIWDDPAWAIVELLSPIEDELWLPIEVPWLWDGMAEGWLPVAGADGLLAAGGVLIAGWLPDGEAGLV
jgi:hypothetical protein